jgi:hypothetical protein
MSDVPEVLGFGDAVTPGLEVSGVARTARVGVLSLERPLGLLSRAVMTFPPISPSFLKILSKPRIGLVASAEEGLGRE